MKCQTTSGELIPDDNIFVLIDKLWIEDNIDLSNKLILKDIGEIPEDDLIDNIGNESPEINDESNIEGKNIMEYDINDLVNKYGMDDEYDDDEYDDDDD